MDKVVVLVAHISFVVVVVSRRLECIA